MWKDHDTGKPACKSWCHSVLAAHPGLRINQSVIDDIDRKMTDKYISQHPYCTPTTPFCPRVGVVEIIMLIKQGSSAVLPLRPSLQHLHNYNFLNLLPNCLLPTFSLFPNADPGLCTLCLLFFHLHPCLGAAARSWCARRVNGMNLEGFIFVPFSLHKIFNSQTLCNSVPHHAQKKTTAFAVGLTPQVPQESWFHWGNKYFRK